MNFAIDTANQTWKQIKARYLILFMGSAAALAAGTLIASGAFDTTSPAAPATTQQRQPDVVTPVDGTEAESVVYFIVDTEAQAATLQVDISAELATVGLDEPSNETYHVLVVDSPDAEWDVNELMSAGWASELGPGVEIVDMRSSAVRMEPTFAPEVSVGRGAGADVPSSHRTFITYLLNTQDEADALQGTISAEQAMGEPSSMTDFEYSFRVIGSPEDEKEAYELSLIAGHEFSAAGSTLRVIDLR